MFEGNRLCSICKKELEENEKNFGITLMGYSHIFCNGCFKNKKDKIKVMLHDEERPKDY